MRYILLTPNFKPNPGGIAEYLNQLWHYIGSHHPAHVFSTVPPQIPSNQKTEAMAYECQTLPDLPALEISTIETLTPQQAALQFLQLKSYGQKVLLPLLRPYLSEPVRIFIGVWQPTTHFWCEALRKEHIPYSIFTYGLEIIYPPSSKVQQWRQADLQAAASVYACSAATAQLVRDRCQLTQPIQVVYPGVQPFINPQAIEKTAIAIREKWHLQNSQTLLSVGRLVPRKGFDLVLQSLPQLRQSFPNLRYLIAGEGADRERLTEITHSLKLDSIVILLGSVDELTKAALYNICEMFVMPNRVLDGKDWEGFGIVFLEAALMGRPSIGGNNGGVSEAIIHNQTGLLVDTTNHQETENAIAQLLHNPGLRHQLGINARTRASNTFTWQKSGQMLLERPFNGSKTISLLS